MAPSPHDNRKSRSRRSDWVAGQGHDAPKGHTAGGQYVQQCRRRAMAVKSKREFGQLSIDTLVYVAREHRLTTMRLGAVKALEAGDTRKHLAALRSIERTPEAGPPTRAAAHQAADLVQARLEAE
ncbi:MAG: hypothetical protein Q7J82_00675 [Coriobacteriia bacterium]|nr:hypothetical protein [Coriobacteriia bacterium]